MEDLPYAASLDYLKKINLETAFGKNATLIFDIELPAIFQHNGRWYYYTDISNLKGPFSARELAVEDIIEFILNTFYVKTIYIKHVVKINGQNKE
jgi:hypothetical protein